MEFVKQGKCFLFRKIGMEFFHRLVIHKLIESIVTKYGKDNYCSILMLISLTSYAQGLMWNAKAAQYEQHV